MTPSEPGAMPDTEPRTEAVERVTYPCLEGLNGDHYAHARCLREAGLAESARAAGDRLRALVGALDLYGRPQQGSRYVLRDHQIEALDTARAALPAADRAVEPEPGFNHTGPCLYVCGTCGVAADRAVEPMGLDVAAARREGWDAALAAVREVLGTARTYAGFTHGNLRGDRYRAREEARDQLLDALSRLDAAEGPQP